MRCWRCGAAGHRASS
ncbi:MAG: hypothetical protein E6K23_04870 [Gammaproteobacteria bacterium]|nr:MAG: hypothetical protein E6K47_15715 [Gammaproteobacteria bacterium]TLY94595.1 MAG: hypothetical protein E6K40_07280 [Gammaproteobacteria bacterium]TLZ05716.1 MAG: hypothetical protein E6K36_01470 [Gammaproteobacteria bacterium]TLZ42092.1 MAG: hypothetical protein E6K23_04870 [Gammaproteobacteria bacterium]